MQMIQARMSLDSIVQNMSVESKLNSENEAHIDDCHGNGNRDRRDDRNYRAIQEDPTIGGDRSEDPGYEDGKTSFGGEYMTPEDHEDAHFFAFVAHNTKAYGHDKGKERKAPPRQGKEPRRIGNPGCALPSTGGKMVIAGSVMGKGDPISTTTKRARCTRRTRGHTSKPIPKKSPRRRGLMRGKRDKLMEVDMWDQAMVAIG